MFELERPFDVPPDAGALVAVDVFKGRNIHWRNSVVDAGAFQFFGGGVDLVAAENVGERFGGFISWGQWHAPSAFIGPTFVATPNWAVQWLDNDVVEGNGVVNYWTASDAVTGADPPAWPLGRWTLNGAALGAIASAADPDPAVAPWTREIAADALLVYRRNRVYSNGYLAAGATFESGSPVSARWRNRRSRRTASLLQEALRRRVSYVGK